MIPREFRAAWVAVAAALVLLSSTAAGLEGTRFSFEVPPGWKDLSSGTGEPALDGIPAEAYVDAKSGKFAALAVDVAHSGDGFGENLKAVVRAGSQPITEAVLEQAVAAMSAATDTEVRAHAVTRIQDVDVGRVIADKIVAARRTRTLVYLLPGQDEHAVLTYEAAPETFDEYLPVFEAAAAATQGVVRVSAPAGGTSVGTRRALWGTVAGVLGLIAVGVALRRLRGAKRAS